MRPVSKRALEGLLLDGQWEACNWAGSLWVLNCDSCDWADTKKPETERVLKACNCAGSGRLETGTH